MDGTNTTYMITALDKNTALVVIDLQDGVVKMNTAHPGAAIVRQSARLVEAFRRAGLPIVIVNVVPFGAPGGKVRTQAPGLPKDEASQKQMRAAMEAAGFFNIVPELGARPEDIYVTKKTWNAFYDTDLENRLRELGVTNIVLCGIATSIGVEGTARAAYERGFNLSFVEDAMTDMVPAAHANSLQVIFPRLGEVGTTDAVIEQLGMR
jgi:nicotinamidase-related amidase